MEAQIHRYMFSLFYSVWTNKQTKIYEIVKYLLQTSAENSRTWSQHLRFISKMYQMEDPLTLINTVPPTKMEYKEYILTKIAAFHERELRQQALKIKSLKYFNVSLQSLRGKPHVSICDVFTSKDVTNMRPHLNLMW